MQKNRIKDIFEALQGAKKEKAKEMFNMLAVEITEEHREKTLEFAHKLKELFEDYSKRQEVPAVLLVEVLKQAADGEMKNYVIRDILPKIMPEILNCDACDKKDICKNQGECDA